MSGYPPWGVSRLSYSLGILVLVSYTEETNSLDQLENCWGRYKGWRNLKFASMGVHPCCLIPGKGRERSALMAAGFPMTASPCTSARAKQMLHSHSLHATVWYWIWGGKDWGNGLNLGPRGDKILGQRIWVGWQWPFLTLSLPQLTTQYTQKNHPSPAITAEQFHKRIGAVASGASDTL